MSLFAIGYIRKIQLANIRLDKRTVLVIEKLVMFGLKVKNIEDILFFYNLYYIHTKFFCADIPLYE